MAGASKLTAVEVARLKKPGFYGDGAGLWLNVTPTGGKSWVLRYTFESRERRTGLGPYPEVTLAAAREAAVEFRRRIRSGENPVEERKVTKATKVAEESKTVTFDWCAEKYISAHKPSWKNPKHAEQWVNTLATYASPIIGKAAVDKIDTAHVMRVLEPIWTQKAETASRLRGRIESILAWATARKFRTGENPARWKGHLDTLLPARSKIARVKHHAALPWKEIARFIEDLNTQEGFGALALRFAILTAARSGEVRGMTWDEVDLKEKIWIIPGHRMKAGKEHRVPLSNQALDVLIIMHPMKQDEYSLVFPSTRKHKPLSDMTLSAVLKRMGRKDITVHGFRSTFRDWVAESTNYPRDVAEMALAHTVSNAVEAAYRRGDMFEKRRQLMSDWDDFCYGKSSS